MYIDIVPNRKSPPAVLLRESRREGGKMVKTTLANLSHWPEERIEALRQLLRGGAVGVDKFAIERSTPHGHVQAVLGLMRKLGMEQLLSSRPCRERGVVLAMLAQRL
ncbi:MAG: IS1634 family transposase, partial [Candidatus Hydrogenedentes bacterium]|nr:IS1634 family transposase [Candidatus Hydrogenedentota bacterium]